MPARRPPGVRTTAARRSARHRRTARRSRGRGGPTTTAPFLGADLDAREFRRAGRHAVDLLADYYRTLPSRAVVPVPSPARLRALRDEPLPRAGLAPRAVLDLWRRRIAPDVANFGSPRFFGYVHGSGLQIGALADLLASGQNPNVADRRTSRVETVLEQRVVGWLAQMIGYPRGSGGILTSGGMAANHAAMLVALRTKAPFDSAEEGLQGRRPSGRFTLYVSEEEGHVTIARAADLLNLGRRAVRRVPCRDDFTMDPGALERMVDADRAAGDHPFLVVGQAGSINVGAIDPLEEIRRICRRRSLWFHVDGAAGAFGAVLPELRPLFAGLDQADSVTLDPHKWLYLPKECGALLVREPRALHRTFHLEADYLEPQGWAGPEQANLRSMGPQSSRGFRALKVWMALHQLGVDGYVRLFRQNLSGVRWLNRWVRDDADFEALHDPTLYVYAWRFRPRDLRPEIGSPAHRRRVAAYLDELNRRLVEATNASGVAFLTTTRLRGRTVLRVSLCNHRTRPEDLVLLVRALKENGTRVDRALRPRSRLGPAPLRLAPTRTGRGHEATAEESPPAGRGSRAPSNLARHRH